METCKRLILDPGHYRILEEMETIKKKEELSAKTGIDPSRLDLMLDNLVEEGLAEREEGKYMRKGVKDRLESLKDSLEGETIGAGREKILEERFSDARESMTGELPPEKQHRKHLAEMEVAEKLKRLSA